MADRIRELRKAKGWLQEDLAAKAKIRQSFIGALEAGNQKNSGYLPEIANALGVSAYWLKTGKGEKQGGKLLSEEEERILQALPLLEPVLLQTIKTWADAAIESVAKKTKRA